MLYVLNIKRFISLYILFTYAVHCLAFKKTASHLEAHAAREGVHVLWGVERDVVELSWELGGQGV